MRCKLLNMVKEYGIFAGEVTSHPHPLHYIINHHNFPCKLNPCAPGALEMVYIVNLLAGN